ncbi:MAG: 2Fe-2S iron-sulfur cluster-binding protein [Acidimicrobiales bacterium]
MLTVDGRPVPLEPGDEQRSLLEVLRLRAGTLSVKDGCSPQGQCGCCTVLVDGKPRVACVTATRRVLGRAVTTLDGLPDATRTAWAEAFAAGGASQCGFCTPGIIVRLAALADPSPAKVEDALLAHLCRCTGWRTILEAAAVAFPANPPEPPGAAVAQCTTTPDGSAPGGRDPAAGAARATLEAGVTQRVGVDVVLGRAGFAADTVPPGALVAVPDGAAGWAVGETLSEARAAANKVQGRRTTLPLRWPIEPPPGAWDLTLATTWVEPAYLEPDCSWCEPGGVPAPVLANGGAFGGKVAAPVMEAARRLADRHGRAVVAAWSREDVVRLGPKRPPLALGARADGTGHVRVARTAGIAEVIRRAAPGWTVEELDVPGPPTSAALRGAGWAEAAAALAVLAGGAGSAEVTTPDGAWARASVTLTGVEVEVACGPPLDEVVLRSWCICAAHQALGWVRSEGVAVDEAGEVHDLTIRSFGILRARDTPTVTVTIRAAPESARPVPGSDAVFAAVAAAAWRAEGLPPRWPCRRS